LGQHAADRTHRSLGGMAIGCTGVTPYEFSVNFL
jgi:hypothetical protein